jgi:hypothetical protein
MSLNMPKYGLGFILGDFFTKASGHPAGEKLASGCLHLTSEKADSWEILPRS